MKFPGTSLILIPLNCSLFSGSEVLNEWMTKWTNKSTFEETSEWRNQDGQGQSKVKCHHRENLWYICTMDNHVDHSFLLPRQGLWPGDVCCLVTWLARPGVSWFQKAESRRAREHAWHHVQEREHQRWKPEEPVWNGFSGQRRLVVGVGSQERAKVRIQEASESKEIGPSTLD